MMALPDEERRQLLLGAMEITAGRLRYLYEQAEALGLATELEKPLAEIEARVASLLGRGELRSL
jgi:hypothetical protein